jgi:Icc-related predicted phosphoesterase
MKITVVSDLHLEQGYQELPGGEVLILSGDIAEAKYISQHHHSTKLVSSTPIHDFRCSEFFWHETTKYEKVFYVMGNHEHYHGRFQETYAILKRIIPKHITLLENDLFDYNGYMFLGATLWTDLNGGDPMTEWHVKGCMNDYRLITWADKVNNRYHKLYPAQTYNTHKESLRYFKEMLETHSNRKFVVVTHHAPSYQSISPRFADDRLGNGGYMSQLDNFILDHPNIVLWTHGHVHNPFDYYIGSTRVVCNPRGYMGLEETEHFNPNLTIEI